MRRRVITYVVGAIIGLLVLSSVLFEVKETEYVVVTQFGKPTRVIKEAGLFAKLPDPLQSVRRFDHRLLLYDVKAAEFVTSDKKNLILDMYLTWRIVDPLRFLASVRERNIAEFLLADVAGAEMGAAIGKVPLSSLVSIDPAEVMIDSIMTQVTENCRSKALPNYGIDVKYVKLKRIRLPEQNLESVFQRMRADRQRIAKKYRSEGEEEAIKIRADADREKRDILAGAYRDAEMIRGEGEAKAAAIYAGAFNKDPRFYKLTRTLQAYEKFLNERTTVVLSTDSELLKLFKER
jgi:membrane protease subunit HflC